MQGYLKKVVLLDNSYKEYFSFAKGMIIVGCRMIDQNRIISKLSVPENHDNSDYYYKTIRDLNSFLINIEITYFDDIVKSLENKYNQIINKI